MKLVIGLGNVGTQYAKTRHNVGFMVLDEIAAKLGAPWKLENKLKADIATIRMGDETVILAKPRTMMNLSGEAAQRLIQQYKLSPNDVWAIYDDVDTPFGRCRIRHGGSSGGHQGIRSLASKVGEAFGRIKVGISLNNRAIEPSEVYVLKPFDAHEQVQLPELIRAVAALTIETISSSTVEDATVDLLPPH